MLRIKDGRTAFYQWDVNRQVVADEPCEVHFCNGRSDTALVVETIPDGNGRHIANVPNVLLQEPRTIYAYLYKADCTREEAQFAVRPRKKPDDYVYSETEVLSYHAYDERLGAFEEAFADFAADVQVLRVVLGETSDDLEMRLDGVL